MLQNAYFLAKIGADTAENEQHFAEILPNFAIGLLDVHLAGPVDVHDVQEIAYVVGENAHGAQ